MTRRNWKLSPSDFAFLWEECKRCFYLKLVSGFKRPAVPFPSIFSVIAAQMHHSAMGQRTEALSPALPGGLFVYGEKWVESTPIAVPGQAHTCYLRGRFDAVARFDDGTYGLIDFKTSVPKPDHVALYARQLHAYARALEQPASGKFGLDGPVSRMGLVVYEPTIFTHHGDGNASLGGSLTWLEVPRDDEAFLAFLGEVLTLLAAPEPPDAAPDCVWCQYRQASRENGL